MAEPEFLICLNCETPCYTFEWANEQIIDAYCESCGNDDPEQFATEEDYESMSGGEKIEQ